MLQASFRGPFSQGEKDEDEGSKLRFIAPPTVKLTRNGAAGHEEA